MVEDTRVKESCAVVTIEFQLPVIPLTGDSYTRYRRAKWPSAPRDGDYVEITKSGWMEMVTNVYWRHDGTAIVALGAVTQKADTAGAIDELFDYGWVLENGKPAASPSPVQRQSRLKPSDLPTLRRPRPA